MPRRSGEGGGDADAMRDIRMSKGARCGIVMDRVIGLPDRGIVLDVTGIVCGARGESFQY